MFKFLKLAYLNLRCPRFYKDMPKENKIGEWEVGSIIRSRFHSYEKGNKIFKGTLQDAYILARGIALKSDLIIQCDEIRIDWFVKEYKNI